MAGGISPTGQAFPQISSPLVDDEGRVLRPWLYLLKALWDRTGGGSGSMSTITGEVRAFAGGTASVPSGWLLCNGTAVSRSTYSSLFSVLGTTWGAGDGSSTFNLPNMQGRTALGASGSHLLGSTGGTESVTLGVSNLPAHNHPVVDPGHTHGFTGTPHTHTVTDPGHSHTSVVGASANTAGAAVGSTVAGSTSSATTGITINAATAGGTNASAVTGVTTGNTGGGAAVTTISPFATVLWIIAI